MPTPGELRTLARGFVNLARELELTRITGELELSAVRVEVIVDRPLPPPADASSEDVEPRDVPPREELVTVKAGPKSKPRTLVAAPAAWLEEGE